MPPPQRPGNRRDLEQHREEVVGGGSVLAASSHLITDVAKDGGGVSPLPAPRPSRPRDRHVMSQRQKRPGKGDLVSTLQAPRQSSQSPGQALVCGEH